MLDMCMCSVFIRIIYVVSRAILSCGQSGLGLSSFPIIASSHPHS